MKFTKFILASAAAFTLAACGGKDDAKDAPKTQSSERAAKVNSDSPLDSAFRLKDAEAIDVDQLFALIPEDGRPTYESATFDDKLGATVVTNLLFSDAGDDEGLLIGRAEFYGVDLNAIDRIKGSESDAVDAPFAKIFEKVRLFDVASQGFDEDEPSFTIGGVEIDSMELRESGFKGDDYDDNPARFFNALNLAGVYFKDFEMAATNDDEPMFGFKAPDFRLVGLGGGKLNAVIMNEAEYQLTQSPETIAAMRQSMGPQGAFLIDGPLRNFIAPEKQRTTINSFEWRGIDFSGLMEYGLKEEEPPVTAKDLIDLGTMNMTDMAMFIGEKQAATIEEATVSAAEFTWLAPSKIRADTKGALYDFTAYIPETEEATLGVLNEYGLNSVKGDGYFEWLWNSDNGDAGLDYVADSEGLADFSMTADFGGFKLKDIAAAKDAGDEAINALGTFNGFSLTVADEKLLDVMFAISALQMGGSASDLRQSAPAIIRLSGAQAAAMNPRITDYVNAVADFVAKGGTLEIKAQPAEPVAFSALQATGQTAPQTLPDVLNLEVTHKE